MTLISIRRPKLQLRALKSYAAPKYPKKSERLYFDLSDASRWPFPSALTSAVRAATLGAGKTKASMAGRG